MPHVWLPLPSMRMFHLVAWSSSGRRARLPRNWAHLTTQVKARAHGRCEAQVHQPTCTGIGTECDHMVQGDDHSLNNLAWLSTPCHAAKTRADNGIHKRLALPPETHPGTL